MPSRRSIAVLALACLSAMPIRAQAPESPAASPRPTHLVFGAYLDAVESDVGTDILTEAYRRLGIKIEIQRFAGDMGIDRSGSGGVDGEVVRVDGIEDRFPNLVQVLVPVTYADVAVYSRDSTLHPRDWRDLTAIRVGTVRGVYYLERAVGELRVRMVDTYAELYPLLKSGQVDAIVASEQQTLAALGPNHPGIYRNGLLSSDVMYHYLNKRHAELVPDVERVLRGMLIDGTAARIRAHRLGEADRPTTRTR